MAKSYYSVTFYFFSSSFWVIALNRNPLSNFYGPIAFPYFFYKCFFLLKTQWKVNILLCFWAGSIWVLSKIDIASIRTFQAEIRIWNKSKNNGKHPLYWYFWKTEWFFYDQENDWNDRNMKNEYKCKFSGMVILS